jgi:hypothetical protein
MATCHRCPTLTQTRRIPIENPPLELDHVVIENDVGPNECALFPRHATDEELMANWIEAHDGAFATLELMR